MGGSDRVLTAAQREVYARDGALVVADFLSAEVCARLIARAEEIAAQRAPGGPRSVFSTAEQTRRSDAWFLGSGDRVRCFFEADAFTGAGELTVEPARAINKIGHALHDLDPVFAAVSYDPRLAEIADDLGMRDAVAVQSMVIFKQPEIGGEVGCHQDATFLYTEPTTVLGLWFALEDATIANGCLWTAPGEHRGPLRKRFVRAVGGGTAFERLDGRPLPTAAALRPLEVPAGTLVLLHGLLPHWSGPNRSSRRRLAYSLHCVERGAVYPASNWLQRGPDMPLRRLVDGPPALPGGSGG